jgi:hypothetical protein
MKDFDPHPNNETIMSINDPRIIQTRQKLTRESAVAWIKRALPGTKFCAHVSLSVAIAEDDSHHYPQGKRTSIKLTRNEAIELVKDYFSEKREQEGWRVPCCEYRHLAYAADEPIPEHGASPDYVCYWIG